MRGGELADCPVDDPVRIKTWLRRYRRRIRHTGEITVARDESERADSGLADLRPRALGDVAGTAGAGVGVGVRTAPDVRGGGRRNRDFPDDGRGGLDARRCRATWVRRRG